MGGRRLPRDGVWVVERGPALVGPMAREILARLGADVVPSILDYGTG